MGAPFPGDAGPDALDVVSLSVGRCGAVRAGAGRAAYAGMGWNEAVATGAEATAAAIGPDC